MGDENKFNAFHEAGKVAVENLNKITTDVLGAFGLLDGPDEEARND